MSPPVSGRNGFVVAQCSLEYSIALLETGNGETDGERANAIINRVLEFQVRDPKHHRCGNFRWMSHWTQPDDPNAAAFVTPNLAYLYRHHAGALTPETCRRFEASFPLCAQALLQHEVPYHYTNIKLLTALGQFLLAPLLPETSLNETARFHWKHFVGFTAQYGIAEYNSPTYLAVCIYALEQMWQFGPEDMRADFERMLEYFYFEFAARYHAPTGYLVGAMSRAYPPDVETGMGLAALVAHLQWGVPRERLAAVPSTLVVSWLTNDYIVSDEITRLAFEKPLPMTIRADSWDRERIARTDYLAAEYSLGSQNGYYGNQEVPLFATARGDDEQSGSVYLQPAAAGLARLASQQMENRVAGYYFFEPRHVRDFALLFRQKPETELALQWHLGQRKVMGELRLNGEKWGNQDCDVAPQSTLAWRLGSAVLGLRFRCDKGADAAKLFWDGDALMLHLGVCPTAHEFVERGEVAGMSFYLQIQAAEESALEAMQSTLDALQWRKNWTTDAFLSEYQLEIASGDTCLRACVAPSLCLHDSPFAQIQPNDLLFWFQSRDKSGRAPFLRTL